MQNENNLDPAWQKFLNAFLEIATLSVEKWKPVHLIGYFAKQYEQYYKISYTFAFNGPPSKSAEIKLIGRLANMLTRDPVILKDYIDWYFSNEIVKRKRRINSIAAIAQIAPINDYKRSRLLLNSTGIVDRTTQLPTQYIAIVEKSGLLAKTYGDLAFMKAYLNSGETNNKYSDVLDSLAQSGFNLDILDRIK